MLPPRVAICCSCNGEIRPEGKSTNTLMRGTSWNPEATALPVMRQHARHETGADVLEGQGRAVKEFEQVDAVLELDERHFEIPRVANDPIEVGFGDVVDERREHRHPEAGERVGGERFDESFRQSRNRLRNVKLPVL